MNLSRLTLAAASLALAACGNSTAPATPAAAAAVAQAAPADDCAGRSPGMVADYQRLLTAFGGSPGFVLDVQPQQVFNDEATLTLTVSEADFGDGLGYSLSYLANCAVFPMGDGNFYDQGNGRWTMTLHTGTGSDVPDGTPATLSVIRTTLLRDPNGGLPKAKTTVVGEYAIRINNPAR